MQFPQKIEAVIFDMAGTLVDFGCFAPVEAIKRTLTDHIQNLSDQEVRQDMGLGKREHIRKLIASQGIPHTSLEIDALNMTLNNILLGLVIVEPFITPCPGAVELTQELRNRNIKIGLLTGYSTWLLNSIIEELNRRDAGIVYDGASGTNIGYRPTRGRPYPDLYLEMAITLGVSDVRNCIVVDDTMPGYLAGERAGMYSMGVISSSSMNGMTLAEWNALNDTHKMHTIADSASIFSHPLEDLYELLNLIRR